MNKKDIVILLSNKDVDSRIFKSNLYKFRRLIYFDAIFEYFDSYNQNELSRIKAIIIDQKMFQGNDFFKTIQLLKHKAKKIDIVVILKIHNDNLKDKLLNLGIRKVFYEPQGKYGIDFTAVIEDTIDDPFITHIVEENAEYALAKLVFSLKQEEQNIYKRFINKIKILFNKITNKSKRKKENNRKEKNKQYDNIIQMQQFF